MTLIKVEGFKCSLNSEIISFNSFVILASWSSKKDTDNDTYLCWQSIKMIGGQGANYGNGCLSGNGGHREERAEA